jgi:hypothetical protein
MGETEREWAIPTPPLAAHHYSTLTKTLLRKVPFSSNGPGEAKSARGVLPGPLCRIKVVFRVLKWPSLLKKRSEITWQ